MKITDIKTYLYHAGIANWQFVKGFVKEVENAGKK
jgi:hypothetical protein